VLITSALLDESHPLGFSRLGWVNLSNGPVGRVVGALGGRRFRFEAGVIRSIRIYAPGMDIITTGLMSLTPKRS
jgi:hypothetical protein